MAGEFSERNTDVDKAELFASDLVMRYSIGQETGDWQPFTNFVDEMRSSHKYRGLDSQMKSFILNRFQEMTGGRE